MKHLFFTLFLSLFILQINAQNFGGHPSDVNWKQINTENVKVIFPEGLETQAFRIANMINYIHDHNTASVGYKSKKLSIVLHNNQVISNGFVGLSPYRSEFFGTSFQDFNILGSMEWLDALTIHEYRHALQFTNGNRGFTRFLHILQGQNGWGVALNLSVPNWYFEGDAVVSETLLSEAGRGRTPSFFAAQRANLLNGHDFTYMKSRNGSFKDIVPDHYNLGFTMCNYTRNEFGTEVWANILADAGSYRYPYLYPFSFALKNNTGAHVHKIYKQAYGELTTQWTEELANMELLPTQNVTEKNEKTVTNYRFPQVLADGSLVAMKNSYKETPTIVKINNGVEQKITDVGIAVEPFFSANNNMLAWTEFKPDVRRANRNYSVVVSYDMSTGKKQYLTTETKYFSPQFNGDGDKIIVVEANEAMENRLVILDKNGSEIQKLPNPENVFLSFPKWTKDDKAIIYIAKKDGLLALFKYNLAENTTTQLNNWTHHVLSAPTSDENFAYFSASFSGIDNIYAVSLNGDKTLRLLSAVKIGAYQPAVNGETLYMSELTDKGYMLTQMTINPKDAKTLEFAEPAQMPRYNITTTNAENNIFDKIPTETHEVKNYNTLLRGLKLHSWNMNEITQSFVSANLQFANVTSDLVANVGVNYNLNEEKLGISGEVTIGKWFTELKLSGNEFNRAAFLYDATDTLRTFTFKDRSFGVGASVPLSWVNGNYSTDVRVSSNFVLHNTSDYSRTDATVINSFGTLENSFTYSRLHRKAVQHILPRYGQELEVGFDVGLTIKDVSRINAKATAYFPGFAATHGVELNVSARRELLDNPYRFADVFEYSRGYNLTKNDNAVKVSANYNFPIAYPDWGFFNAVYFKRIRGNVFADFSSLGLNGTSSQQNSVGAELIFDNIFINLVPISFGFRESYLLNKDELNPNRTLFFETFTAVNL